MSLFDLMKTKTSAVATEVTKTPEIPKPAGDALEDVLLDLSKWGNPRVGQYGTDGKWHCCVEVNVTPVGVKFEAKSDFNQKTPTDAAIQCRENLRAAVKAIGGAA